MYTSSAPLLIHAEAVAKLYIALGLAGSMAAGYIYQMLSRL